MNNKISKILFSKNAERITVNILLALAILLSMFFSFTLFHSYIEVYTMVLSVSIFIVAWNSYKIFDNKYLVFIGIGLLFISVIDLTHTFAYDGLRLFEGFDQNLPTQLWIAARFMAALSFVIAPIFFKIKHHNIISFLSFLIVTIIIYLTIFAWKIFPNCFIENLGLTYFYVYSEYVIICLFILGMILLQINKKNFDKKVYQLIQLSILFQILAELSFTKHMPGYNFANMFGLVVRLIGVYLIYWAVVVIGLEEPLSFMATRLKLNEEKYNAIFNNINSAIAVYKPTSDGKDFIITDFNQTAEKIDNIKKEKIVGKKITEAFPGVKKMGIFDALTKVNKTGEDEHLSVSFYKDNRISGWRENYIYKLSNGEIVASYSDVTAQKQAEEQLIKRAEEIEKFNNLMVGRENRMAEMKKEIEKLKKINNISK